MRAPPGDPRIHQTRIRSAVTRAAAMVCRRIKDRQVSALQTAYPLWTSAHNGVLWAIVHRRRSILGFGHGDFSRRRGAVTRRIGDLERDGVDPAVAAAHSFRT